MKAPTLGLYRAEWPIVDRVNATLGELKQEAAHDLVTMLHDEALVPLGKFEFKINADRSKLIGSVPVRARLGDLAQ